MVKNSKQTWVSGSTVKVGFLSLVVVEAVPTPGDYMPDAYILTNKTGDKLYKFVPHNGIERITEEEFECLRHEANRYAKQQADSCIKNAKRAIYN